MSDQSAGAGGAADVATTGRKVFFLYPHSVMQEQLIQIIFHAEYEAYLIRDHVKVVRLLADFPDSILFVNIDERIRELDWKIFVEQLMSSPATASVRVGILSYEEDPALVRHYLMKLMAPCGFIKLKIGLAESARILLSVLEVNEARGKRRHVRAVLSDESRITFNIKVGHLLVSGLIRDISLAGMACQFDEAQDVAQGTRLSDIQLNLRGAIVRISGTVAGSRETPDGPTYVILFEVPEIGEARRRVHTFIYNTLQAQMDRRLAAIT
ncbi:MAG TPA: PilZ domain-containing protein [Spirochaetia bacterium]|nr:PilZ domain-containing protein [Spirochaetia bacterium]